MVNLVDLVPTFFALPGIEIPQCMQGQPLPPVVDAPPRDATFSEYGSGGPAFRHEDLEKLGKTLRATGADPVAAVAGGGGVAQDGEDARLEVRARPDGGP